MNRRTGRDADMNRRRRDYLALAIGALLVRAPFFLSHHLVTYDGTVYLREAQALLHLDKLPGAFPIGYPAAAALLQLIVRDWVVAGQLVSLLAAVGSTLLVYHLLAARAGRLTAIVAAAVLALNPLFIRLSLQTMSESLYVFLVLLAVVLVLDRRMAAAGLALGAATVTRPEAIAIAAVVAWFHIRAPRRLATLVVSFAVVFAANSAVLSVSQGTPVLLPKTDALGSATRDWLSMERTIDYELPPAAIDQKESIAREPEQGLVAYYVRAMPRELGLLVRHAWPAVMLLAVWGIWRTGWHVLLAPLLPLFVFTLFTKRHEGRFILPYIPFLVIYAALGAAALRRPTARQAALAVLAVSALGLLATDRDQLTEPEEPGLENLREAGLALDARIAPPHRVADRKPHLAFYAGGRYVEMPAAPYDDTIASLAADGVEWLSLHRETIHRLRPALRPLMYSRAVINGELRYEQVYYQPDGEMVFRHRRDRDPLEWTRLTTASKADVMAAWSPDGGRIALRRQHDDGTVALAIASRRNRAVAWGHDNIDVVEVAVLDGTLDRLAWSPDGERIAFARRNTGTRTDLDLFAVDVYSQVEERLVSSTGDDRSPSWPAAGRIYFARAASGRSDIWVADPARAAEEQITDTGACEFPVAAPGGNRLAWTEPGKGVSVLDFASGRVTGILAPRQTTFAPSWGPGGNTLAVTANDWGSYDIYLMKADGSNVLLLTKGISGESAPAWSPDGSSVVVVSDRDGDFNLWILQGLRPYLERLQTTVDLNVFTPIAERTNS